MRFNSFRFNLQELGGALGDLGTLLPITIALILVNGLNATTVLMGVGLAYIASGLYYRIPMPVQPLKLVAATAIALGLSSGVISAAALLMGVILLGLSITNLINVVVRLFPKAVVRGVQLSVGLILFRRGIDFALGHQTLNIGIAHSTVKFPLEILLAISALFIFAFFKFILSRQEQYFPASLALIIFGLGAGVVFQPVSGIGWTDIVLPKISLPSVADFWLALTVLVIPQLPLTLGNAVVATNDTARVYFKDRATRVTPRALTTSMGLVNVAAGLFGAMPICHGSGGLSAHYNLGARTAGASLMIGILILTLGLFFGGTAIPFLSLIPLPVLGVLLAIVGVYHALLARDLSCLPGWMAAVTVAAVTIALGSLAYGFIAGLVIHHVLRVLQKASVRQTFHG